MASVPELDLGGSHAGDMVPVYKNPPQQKHNDDKKSDNKRGMTALSVMGGVVCHHCGKSFTIGETVRYCSTHREENHGHIPLGVGFILPDDIVTCDKCHKAQKVGGATTTLVTTMRSEGECSPPSEKDKEYCNRHKLVKFSI